MLFIEEPEMMMHPAMQRILIETLINKFGRLQVFLTTHSNHFLDLTYDYPHDVAIYSFEEADKEHFQITNISNQSLILDLLGIRNSSVFLANCVIWTEGVTDRIILRKLMELDSEFNLIEDKHYAFAEYGGGNLENFDFVEVEKSHGANVSALSRTNFLIADNDGEKSGKRFERRQRLRTILGEDNFFDDHVEIENLIPYRVWEVVLRRITEDQPNKEIQIKELSAAVESRFNNAISSKKIGQALRLLVEKKPGKDPDYSRSNDVKCLGESKKAIAEYIVAAIDESKIALSDFPTQTQNLVSSIKKFIYCANGK